MGVLKLKVYSDIVELLLIQGPFLGLILKLIYSILLILIYKIGQIHLYSQKMHSESHSSIASFPI